MPAVAPLIDQTTGLPYTPEQIAQMQQAYDAAYTPPPAAVPQPGPDNIGQFQAQNGIPSDVPQPVVGVRPLTAQLAPPAIALPPPSPDVAANNAAATGPVPPPTIPRKDETTTQTTVSRTVLSPQQKANLERQQATLEEQKKAVGQMGEVEKQKATDTAELTTKEAEATADRARRVQEVNAQADKERADAKATLDAAVKEREGLKPTEYWGTRTDGQKIGILLGVAIGGWAQVMGRMGSNGAMDILNSAIHQHWEEQRQKTADADAKVLMARTGIHDADEAREVSLRAVDANTLAGINSIKSEMAKRMAAAGIPAAEIQATLEKLKLQLTQNQIEAKALEGTEKKITTTTLRKMTEGGTGPNQGRPTESQAKAADYLTGMVAEHERMEALPPMSHEAAALLRQQIYLGAMYEKSPTAALLADLTRVNRDISERLPPQDRQAVAAAMRWLDPIMRERSGAVIRPDEAQAYVNNFFRQKGDTETDVKVKRQSRIDAMRGMSERTQNPQAWVDRINAASAQGGAPAAPTGPARMNAADAQALLKFVRDNPNDPRAESARAILRQNGLLR